MLIWSTISKVHESLNYIIFMHLKENIPLNEYDKTIIQKSITQLISFFSFDWTYCKKYTFNTCGHQ